MTAKPVYHSPAALFRPTGPWSMLATAGQFTFVSGIRGIDPDTDQLVTGEEERVRQIFRNIRRATESVGAGLDHVVRLTVFVTDMARHRPIVNRVQAEFWDAGFPPRTIVQVSGLNQDDCVEVETTVYHPDPAG
jgi:enamine deaminase RidA (YjgF/YER057c/UK114 family)